MTNIEKEEIPNDGPNQMRLNIGFSEAELTKLSLNPGEVLGVTIKTDSDINEGSLVYLKEQLESLFPKNQVMLFCMKANDSLIFTAIEAKEKLDCGPQACEDCGCGKKEQLEALYTNNSIGDSE